MWLLIYLISQCIQCIQSALILNMCFQLASMHANNKHLAYQSPLICQMWHISGDC